MTQMQVLYVVIALFYSACSGLRQTWTSKRMFTTFVQLHAEMRRPSGYVPPELDPEYRFIAYKPKISVTDTASSNGTATDLPEEKLPLPKEGDIVCYKGRFGDVEIGKLRFLQYIETYDAFFADIVPLKESKTPQVYIIDRKAKAEYLPITEIQPVKAYYIRKENGHQVAFQNRNGTRTIALKAAQSRPLDRSFAAKKSRVSSLKPAR